MTVTTSGAVALLLYNTRADQESNDSLVEAILALRELVGAPTRELVDRWIVEGGPDGEQVYCLEHVLGERFRVDPGFRTAVEGAVGAGPVAREAIAALADHCRRRGFRGAYAWCQAALSVPTAVRNPC